MTSTNSNNRLIGSLVSALIITSNVNSLKLTPVQSINHRLDLDEETKTITTAFNDAKALIADDSILSVEQDVRSLINNLAIKRLHKTIERWSLIEDKLRGTISSTNDHANQVIKILTVHGNPIGSQTYIIGLNM